MCGVVILEEQIHLVHEYPCVPSGQPICRHAVLDRLQHHIQCRRLELFTHLVEVKTDNAVINIKIGFVGEHIQAALHEQLRCKGQFLCFTLRLPLDLVAPIRESRNPAFAAALDEIVIDIGGTTVNDRLMERPQLSDTHLLLANAHHQFGLHSHRVLPGSIAPVNIQRIDVVRAGWRDLQHRPLQCPRQLAILTLGVDHNNVVIGREGNKGDSLLHAEGLAAARYTQHKAVWVQQLLSVADQKIFAYGVDAIINTARILDLLNAERH